MTNSPGSGRFATLVCCIDGRFIGRSIDQVSGRFGVRHVDTVTMPGVVKLLTVEGPETDQLLNDVAVSERAHKSHQVAIIAHADCAGNPVADSVQRSELATAASLLKNHFPDHEIMALFLDPRTGFDRIT